MNRIVQLALTSIFVVACGGAATAPSIPSEKKMAALSELERHDFCAWSATIAGGEGQEIDCGGGRKATVGKVDECVTNLLDCKNGTYEQARKCTEELSKDMCGTLPASCFTFMEACFGDAADLKK